MPRFRIKNPYRWILHLLLLGPVMQIVVQGAGLWRTYEHPSDAVPVALGIGCFLALFLWFSKTAHVQLADDRLKCSRWGARNYVVPYAHIEQVRRQHNLIKLGIREPPTGGFLRWLSQGGFLRWLSQRASRRPDQWWIWIDPEGPEGSCWMLLDLYDPEGFLSALRLRAGTPSPDSSDSEREDIQEPIVETVCADRWRRLLAFAFDAFALVSILCSISLASVQLSEEDRLSAEAGSNLVLFAWVTYLWASNATGVSAGKFLFGIRVTRTDKESAPGAVRGFLRTIAVGLSLACFGLGYLWSLWDRDRRAWHDMLTGTRVVQVTARRKAVEEPVASARL